MSETDTEFSGAITEMRAGKVMLPIDEASRSWNNATERCIAILMKYRDGHGLFQRIEARKTK